MYKTFQLIKLKGRGQATYLSLDGKIILEWVLRNQGGKMWIGFIWLMIGTSGRLL
jgi:hypothetical protein